MGPRTYRSFKLGMFSKNFRVYRFVCLFLSHFLVCKKLKIFQGVTGSSKSAFMPPAAIYTTEVWLHFPDQRDKFQYTATLVYISYIYECVMYGRNG
jgi:hypothetical protein